MLCKENNIEDKEKARLFEDPFLPNFFLVAQVNVYCRFLSDSGHMRIVYSIYRQDPCNRRGIILYQSVCPFVRIGSPPPLSHKRVCVPPPLGTKWGGQAPGNTRLRVRGRGVPIRTSGEKALHSVYSVPVTLCSM